MQIYEIDPWGEERADLRMGVVASTIANVNRDPKKSRPFKPSDFLLFGERKEKKPISEHDLANYARALKAIGRKRQRLQPRSDDIIINQ